MAMQPRNFDERMIVERDGLLLMLVRLLDGIGESTSTDCGRTWTPGVYWTAPHVNSRIFIRRLRSGNLLPAGEASPLQRRRRLLHGPLAPDGFSLEG